MVSVAGAWAVFREYRLGPVVGSSESSMAPTLTLPQVRLAVRRGIRAATGVPVKGESSLWFDLGLGRIARNLLYWPIRDALAASTPSAKLHPVDLTEATTVGDIESIVWGAL